MDELEELLRAYRPVGPPTDLRQQIVHAVAKPRDASSKELLPPARDGMNRVWMLEWAPAAGALAALLLLQMLAAGVSAQLRPAPSPEDRAREEAIRTLMSAFGDDQAARDAATPLVTLDERGVREDEDRAVAAAFEPSFTSGVAR